jgi:hypothetical protein
MPTCQICGETMPEGTRTCTLCGSSMPDLAAVAQTPAAPVQRSVTVPANLPPGGRYCPSCGIVYDVDYTDVFCICGTELVGASAAPPVAADKPPAGTRCLVLYGPDRQPRRYFALAKDVTLIGRLDAPAGNFPDIDLDEWLDPATARKISRQHALVLRSRANGSFSLRPLAGNTGTQLETEMVLPMHDYVLTPGQRLILGGVARLKFEIA